MNGKSVVCAFGRFQPPTRGHEKMVQLVHQLAKEQNADPIILVSPTVDDKGTNPLTWAERVAFMKMLMPWATIEKHDPVRDPWKMIDWLKVKGYEQVCLVAGSDRVPEYQTRWANYARVHFQNVSIHDAGERDPDGIGVEAMSATKARQFAKQGDMESFIEAVGWHQQYASVLYSILHLRLNRLL